MAAQEPFFDRHEELAFLRKRYTELARGELLVFYGRRRLGKTRLVKRFLDEVPGRKLYSYISLQEAPDLKASFARDIRDMLGDSLAIERWSDFFDHIHRAASHSKLVVVIDEFQRLKELAPGFVTDLQRHWDEHLKGVPLMLILVGSSIGMTRKLTLSATGPLYGRKTGQLRLRPFRYVDFREMFAGLDEETKVRWYAVFGGTPAYLELAGRAKGLHEAIRQAVLEKTAPLRDEPKALLESELRLAARYNSILHAIAGGKGTIKEIADATKLAPGALPFYLDRMMNLLDIVEKREPLFGKERMGRYVISDNFFRFWFRFVFPHQSALELGDVGRVEERIRAELSGHEGRVFEDIVRELFTLYNGTSIKGLPLAFDRIGGWWDRAGNEIDLVIDNKDGLICGEVKWTSKPVDAGELDELMRRASLLRRGGLARFVLVSKSGFTEACEALAGKTGTTLLTLQDVKRLLDAATGVHIERRGTPNQ